MLSERFLDRYNEELRFLRESGMQFAERHPQIARHLGMHADSIQDPFIERLLEGTAFLSSRVHERIDNEYPEFALQMLSRLAPLWYTPVPAIATVDLSPDLTSPQWQSCAVLPRGSVLKLNDTTLNNKPAVFTTGRTVNLQPVTISHAECSATLSAQLPDAVASLLQGIPACIRLKLTTHGIKPLSEVSFDPLHLSFSGDAVRANQLLSTLLNHCQHVVLWAKNSVLPVVQRLSPTSLQPGGVSGHESLLPGSIGELPGSRLLREYFAAPSRFYSVELHQLNAFLAQCGNLHEFELIFALDLLPHTLVDRISAQDFSLFATPIINLYSRRCDPVVFDPHRTEHQLIVDRLNPAMYEIHHLSQVQGTLKDGGSLQFSMLPEEVCFDQYQPQAGYAVRRKAIAYDKKYKKSAFGHNELFITLSSGSSGVLLDEVKTLSVNALICDRHLFPEQLQNPVFHAELALPVKQISLLRPPSIPRPVPDISLVWQAVQMVSVNPLRYARPQVANSAALLRNWLTLFSWPGDVSHSKRIASLSDVEFSHCFEHYCGAGPIAWNLGVTARLNLRGDHHADQGAFLFGRIIHYALSEYCQLNQTLRMALDINGEPTAQWGPLGDDV
ncbi:type VI secretion system baseplate subunit TssF [Winslowiella iniecta]|uniref:Type VI secretion protein TssF n=1 Tax=Winslowiella iniecta TaxID=1560201 RepID=A0A0L7T5S9_9GAMM|nr:type VI secretion system baseplate subunit TssF [Winslowiella iniecta]KOC88569.1 type VI secretion protein TssF [Winslowiella iniecta]KOC90551.1 type VI secretion protein TssF [Winslowiella iniecta]